MLVPRVPGGSGSTRHVNQGPAPTSVDEGGQAGRRCAGRTQPRAGPLLRPRRAARARFCASTCAAACSPGFGPALSRGPGAAQATVAPGLPLSLAGFPGTPAAGVEGVPGALRPALATHVRCLRPAAFLMLISSSTQELGRKSFFDFQTHGSFLPVLKTVDLPSPWLRPLPLRSGHQGRTRRQTRHVRWPRGSGHCPLRAGAPISPAASSLLEARLPPRPGKRASSQHGPLVPGPLRLDASFRGNPRGSSSRAHSICLTLLLLLLLSAVFCPLSQTAS